MFDVWVANMMDMIMNDPETFANFLVCQICLDIVLGIVVTLLAALKADG